MDYLNLPSIHKLFLQGAIALLGLVQINFCPILTASDLAAVERVGLHVFEEESIVFSGRFEGSRINGVEKLGANHFRIEILPEIAPINNSPWYAFEITSAEAQEVQITLSYEEGSHRYAPKFRYGGPAYLENHLGWTTIEEGLISKSEETGDVTFPLQLRSGESCVVSAQPLTRPLVFWEWISGKEGIHTLAGYSVEGRPIPVLEAGVDPAKPFLVLVAGQHPPESTGHFGFRRFCERILAEDSLAVQFRREFGVVVVPLVNPDGLSHGNWRTNLQGLDTNRHWGEPWKAVEPERVTQHLLKVEGNAALFVDFHSTARNVFYTFEEGSQPDFPNLVELWTKAIMAEFPEMGFERREGHNPGLSVSRLWALKELGCDALTYEYADAAALEQVAANAEFAAQSLMELLLEMRSGF